MNRRNLACIVLVNLTVIGCASNVSDDTGHTRFRNASEIAFVDGLRDIEPEGKSILVLPVDGETLLDGDWSDRRHVEKQHRARRSEHTLALEDLLRDSGWQVIPLDPDMLRRLRLQYARIAEPDFVSLATHVGSALGAEVVVVPRLDYLYESKLDTNSARWTSSLDWSATYRFVDVESDMVAALRHVDTREPFSVARWTDRPSADEVAARAASAMRATGDGVEASTLAWLALHLASYGIDVVER